MTKMNDKENYLDKITDIVVSCTAHRTKSGGMSITREDLLGDSRKENIVMARSILVMLILGEGYSVSTVSEHLGRTSHAIRNLVIKGHDFYMSSLAFRIANAQATLMLEEYRKQLNYNMTT